MNPSLEREKLKAVALYTAGLIAVWCMFIIGWCTMWKIYIEIPVLFVLSNMATGITSCITTILVGRTLAQLNQGAETETTTTQSTQTVTKPKTSPVEGSLGTVTNPLKTEQVNTEENPAIVKPVVEPLK